MNSDILAFQAAYQENGKFLKMAPTVWKITKNNK